MKKLIANILSNILITLLIFFKIKLFKLNVGRIGHLVEIYFLYTLKKKHDQKTIFLCYLYDKKNICNDFIFSKFKKELKIIPSVFGNFIEKLMNYAEISQEKKSSVFAFNIHNKKSGWENYNGEILNINLKTEEENNFEKFLKLNNITKPYICLNLWSFEHLKNTYKNIDWSHHDLRISKSSNYYDLINYISEKNMNIVIMGHDKHKFKNIKSDKIFNYSEFRNDEIDFFLIKNCYCYISDCTGLDYLAFTLKKPMLLNTPFLNFFFNKNNNIMYLIKYQFNKRKNKISNLKDMLYEDKTLFKVKSEYYKKKEILIKDNSSIEILKAYKNLENLIKNNKCDQSVEKYTHLFWNYYSKYINEKNYLERSHYNSGPYPFIFNNLDIES